MTVSVSIKRQFVGLDFTRQALAAWPPDDDTNYIQQRVNSATGRSAWLAERTYYVRRPIVIPFGLRVVGLGYGARIVCSDSACTAPPGHRRVGCFVWPERTPSY